MKVINFIIIKLTFFLVVGILIGYFYPILINYSFTATFIFSFLSASFYVLSKKKIKQNIWFGFTSFLLMIAIGVLTISLHNQKNFESHYSKQTYSNQNALVSATFRVREILKPGNYYNKYVIDILKINGEKTDGKSLLNLQKDSANIKLRVDDVFISKIQFKNLIAPLNPNQFNYKKYLDKKYIYHQIFTTNTRLFKTDSKHKTIFGIASTIRSFINKKLKLYNFKPDELAIIKALLLGQRQDISENIYTNYTNAGAIHILAISGLHIGIILLILNFILTPIEQIKHGRILKTILLLLILWSFAIIAGLSASITRAVTMFSIVAIGMNLKRPTNIFNTLAISIFILLLIKPMFLFDVGFQLSYLAVFAIVIIDPLLYKLWKPKNKVIKFYWHTLTITISAQFGIIPISLYYFHQIPSLFFISNLVIIPCLGVILGLGILILLLAILNLLPQFMANLYGSIISLMNYFIEWVAQQNDFLFKNISFNLLYVFTTYAFIISLINFWKKRNITSFKYLLIGIIILQSSFLYMKHSKTSNKFIVFHKSRQTLLGNISNNKIKVAHDLDSLAYSETNIIKDYIVGNHIKHDSLESIKNLYFLNNKTLFVIDSLGAYNTKLFQSEYLLLRQSPQINLSRLIDSIKPKYIIADGSNYKSYINQWEAICKKQKLPFHQTSKKGAFIISY